MEVKDVPLSYALKFWYWADECPFAPHWWKSFLLLEDNRNRLEEILSEYASLTKSDYLPATMVIAEFYSYEHLTQFILKYC